MATQTKQTATKVKKTVKAESVAETVAETIPETVPETVAETVPETEKDIVIVIEEEETMKERFDRLIKSKQDSIVELRNEIVELKKMQKFHEQAIKSATKRKRKVPLAEGEVRKPSGFALPVVVSDALYKFLSQYDVKKGDLVARTDVTKYISRYIKEKDLQNPAYRREIIPDASLQKLLGPALEEKEDGKKVYTYLKLQKYLSAHFPKSKSA